MSDVDYVAELIATAEAMLQGKLHLIEGCRMICGLRHHVDPENKVFLRLRGIESETDHFLLGKVREKGAPEYIWQMDAEMDKYLAKTDNDILDSCRKIIRVYLEEGK